MIEEVWNGTYAGCKLGQDMGRHAHLLSRESGGEQRSGCIFAFPAAALGK
jgi:hypothetical protein